MDREVIVPSSMRRIAQEKGYAPAVRAGGLLFVAGQVGRTADLQVIDDPEAQFAACFENLRLVLEAAGCGFEDIVDMTTYHIDLDRHWEVFRTVKNRVLPRGTIPLTCVGVTALAQPGLLLEVKAIAVAPLRERNGGSSSA